MSGRARWRRALQFARPHRLAIAVILGLTLLTGAASALEPWLFGRIFDALAPGKHGELLSLVLALAGLEAGREALSSLCNWLTWRTRIALNQQLLDTTVGRLKRLPLRFHRDQGAGEVMTRVDRGIQGFVDALTQLTFNALPALVYLGVSLLVMVRLDASLTVVVLLFVPLPALVGVLAAPEQTRRERTLLERWSKIYSRFNEVLHGIVTVRSFGMEEDEQRRFMRDVDAANRVVVRGVAIDTSVTMLRNLLVTTARIAALGYGAWLVVQGRTSAGTVLTFVGYIGGLFGPVQGLTGIYQTVQRARVSLDAVFDILDVQEDPADPPHPLRLARVGGHVRFEGVRFAYSPGDRFAVDGIDLEIQAGERVAIVGASGSGKTTLMSLLQRLYDPTEGRVLLDGIDLRLLDQRALRRQIGVVLQDGVLFNETVAANIAYGRPDASRAEVIAAARAANADAFLRELPKGYDTVVGERGSLLSVGQRQRVAIARALLKDPPLLILDEATSALDAETEARVQEALDRLLQGRTSFTIAHRLATVVRSDRILVMREGRIVEQGTHEALLRRNGAYASLVRRQLLGLRAA